MAVVKKFLKFLGNRFPKPFSDVGGISFLLNFLVESCREGLRDVNFLYTTLTPVLLAGFFKVSEFDPLNTSTHHLAPTLILTHSHPTFYTYHHIIIITYVFFSECPSKSYIIHSIILFQDLV